MNLLIDIGNSRIKWAIYENHNLEEVQACLYERPILPKELKDALQYIAKPPSRVLIANVAGDELALSIVEFLNLLWSIKPDFINVEKERCGVINGYKNISELGVDRWLALLAVWSQHHEAACIVDCGTALTIDVIDHNGVYQGGFIIPGPRLMQETLIDSTSNISVSVDEQYTSALGTSTLECVRNGAGLATASFVDRITSVMKQQYGAKLHCVITGGGASQISGLLEHAFKHQVNLVLLGLAALADNKL